MDTEDLASLNVRIAKGTEHSLNGGVLGIRGTVGIRGERERRSAVVVHATADGRGDVPEEALLDPGTYLRIWGRGREDVDVNVVGGHSTNSSSIAESGLTQQVEDLFFTSRSLPGVPDRSQMYVPSDLKNW